MNVCALCLFKSSIFRTSLTALHSLGTVSESSLCAQSKSWAPLCPWRWWYLYKSTCSPESEGCDSSPLSPTGRTRWCSFCLSCTTRLTSCRQKYSGLLRNTFPGAEERICWPFTHKQQTYVFLSYGAVIPDLYCILPDKTRFKLDKVLSEINLKVRI